MRLHGRRVEASHASGSAGAPHRGPPVLPLVPGPSLAVRPARRHRHLHRGHQRGDHGLCEAQAEVMVVKPDPPKPEPHKPPPPPDRAPTRWRVIAALLAGLLLALCYGQASRSRAEEAVSHALGSVASPSPAPTSEHPPRITFRRHVEFHASYQLNQLRGHLGHPAHRRASRRRRGG